MTDKKDLGALIRELWVEDHKHVNKQHMPNNAGVLLAFAAERRPSPPCRRQPARSRTTQALCGTTRRADMTEKTSTCCGQVLGIKVPE